MVQRIASYDRTVSSGQSVLRFEGGLLTGVESLNDPSTHQAARRLLQRATPSLAELAAVDHDIRVLARQAARARQVVA
jgi:hypothetical protein